MNSDTEPSSAFRVLRDRPYRVFAVGFVTLFILYIAGPALWQFLFGDPDLATAHLEAIRRVGKVLPVWILGGVALCSVCGILVWLRHCAHKRLLSVLHRIAVDVHNTPRDSNERADQINYFLQVAGITYRGSLFQGGRNPEEIVRLAMRRAAMRRRVSDEDVYRGVVRILELTEVPASTERDDLIELCNYNCGHAQMERLLLEWDAYFDSKPTAREVLNLVMTRSQVGHRGQPDESQ